MKKMIAAVAVVASFLLTAAPPADAGRGGRGGGEGSVRGSGHGQGHGFRGGHHGFRPARVVGGRVFVGVGPGWWGPYWGAGPYWGYPYAPYYYPPAYGAGYTMPVVSEPQSYIQQPVPTNYWYYCEGAQAYYPYVQQCPGGWLTVVPQTPPEPPR